MEDAETRRFSAAAISPSTSGTAELSEKDANYLREQTSAAPSNIHRSISLTDGYSVFSPDEDDEKPEPHRPQDTDPDPKAELLVQWDENDPENPRSMSYARKWLICIVVCMGSVCV